MPYFGIPIRNGLPIGLGSVAGFGVQQFSPADLFSAGEQGAWYDPSDYSTLFQDSAGTTPVTAVEQFVGLMLDKSKGLVPFWSGYFDGTGDFLTAPSNSAFALGTGAFTIECWAYLSAVNDRTIFGYASSNSGGIAVFADSAPQRRVYLNNLAVMTVSGNFPANTWVHIAVTGDGANNIFLWQNGVQIGTVNTAYNITSTNFQIGRSLFNDFSGYISNLRVVKGAAIYTGNFTPPAVPLAAISGTSLLTCQSSTFIDNSPNNFTITVNGNTVTSQRIPFGNHATQTTSAKRPKLAARYNLLTYSEQFDNGVWTREDTTLGASQVLAPDETTTAEFLRESTVNADHVTYQAITAIAKPYTFSVYIKAAGRNFAAFTMQQGVGPAYAIFDLSNGTVVTSSNGTSGSGTSAAIQQANNGYWRCSITSNASAGNLFPIICISNSSSPSLDSYNRPTYAGNDPTSNPTGIYVWGAQLIVTNSLTSNTYQRVVDAATYDAVGFLPYLEFNGLSWSMGTGSIDATAVDKAQVFAGARKLSDALYGTVIETSVDSDANNGSLAVFNPNSAKWDMRLKGNGLVGSSFSETYTAPLTNVLTLLANTAGATFAEKLIPRINGVVDQDSTTGAIGTGNFGNYPLYIGQRGGSSLPFNGWLSSLIVRFGANLSQGQIEATESWVNQKTGAF
jgi:hypothetical protein